MLTIRALEHRLTSLSQAGQLRGSLHLAEGQEACPAGVCAALNPLDGITMTYRGHGYVIAKGCDLNAVVAEILGRKTGLCGGKGGKMHLIDLANGVYGANGIVGAAMGPAAGVALSHKMSGNHGVAVTVFGDGAINQGHGHEVMNIAGLMKLPLVLICENNLYAEMTPLARSSAVTVPSERVSGYGIPAKIVDGNDVHAVFEATQQAVENARKGGGPTFLELKTYRVVGHYQNDPGTSYRTQKEIEEWKLKDPIARLAKAMKLKPDELQHEQDGATERVDSAIQFALNSPYPEVSELETGVFA